MKKIILLFLFVFSTNCLAQDLPVVKFPSKKEIEKAKIKELIKLLDVENKEALLKEDQQKKEPIENPKEEQQSLPQVVPNSSSPKLYNVTPTNKPIYYTKPTYQKKTPIRSKLFCPT